MFTRQLFLLKAVYMSTYYRQQASVGDHWEDEDDKLMV